MKLRIAKKIINRISVYQNFDSNYQPYSEGQIVKCLKRLHYPINLRKFVILGKIPTKYRKCNTVNIIMAMHRLNANPRNIKEYNSFMRNILSKAR